MALIARRELGDMFSTPTLYIIFALFQILNGLFFTLVLHHTGTTNLAFFYLDAGLVILLIVPAVVMDSFVKEKREGTFELLLTAPIESTDIVIGKFAAYGTLVFVLVSTTVQYPFFLSFFAPVDGGRVLAGTLGCFLLALAVAAIGFVASLLARRPASACILTIAVVLSLWCFRSLARAFSLPLRLSLYERFVPMTRGMVDTGDTTFFLIIVIFSLVLSVRILESRQGK